MFPIEIASSKKDLLKLSIHSITTGMETYFIWGGSLLFEFFVCVSCVGITLRSEINCSCFYYFYATL